MQIAIKREKGLMYAFFTFMLLVFLIED